jgi:transcriptional regulator with XRE-family HTH domain
MPSNSDIRERLGAAVRAVRVHAKMSQEELARRSGLDRTYIGGVERGERNPSLVSLHRIAGGLNMTLSALFAHLPAGRERD